MERIQKNLVCKAICGLLTLVGFSSCLAQIPENRPYCEDQEFDDKVAHTISFTVPLIGVEELAKKQKDYYILDTRAQSEYDVSHIPNAKYIGYRDFDLSRVQDIPKDAPIVVYCSIGYRSEKIGEQLLEAGYTNVQNLYGSLFEWVNAGEQIIDNQGVKTKKVHTYNRNWSKWVLEPGVQKTW